MTNPKHVKAGKKALAETNAIHKGKEACANYGYKAEDICHSALPAFDEADFDHMQRVTHEIYTLLVKACEEGDPAGATAQHLCTLHQEWLTLYWGHYSKSAHLLLAKTYVKDPNFKMYYDAITPGGASMLRDALEIYCKNAHAVAST